MVSWGFSWKQSRDADRAAKAARERADNQHAEDQATITNLGADLANKNEQLKDEQRKLTEEQHKLNAALSREQQMRKPVRVMFDEPKGQKYVPRPEVLTELFGRLFTSKSGRLIVGGDFGVGKTWAAQECARIAGAGLDQSDHVAPFPGGLLWASLGLQPDISGWLKRWHDSVQETNVTLTDGASAKLDPAVVAPTAEASISRDDRQVAAEVATYLSGRRPLVIIDDVWDVADADALLAAARGCLVLLTTSSQAVFKAFTDDGAAGVRLGGLSPEQARQLLGEFVEAALDAPATPTAHRKRDAFLAELSRRVDTDPFTVVQVGAFVHGQLAETRGADGERLSWGTISERDLGAVIREIAGNPDALPAEVTDHSDWIQPEHRPGPDPFWTRLKNLHDPAQRAVLQTLSLLRPRPEQFTAAEITAMIIPWSGQESQENGQEAGPAEPPSLPAVQAALHELAAGFYLERTEVFLTDPDALPVNGGPAARPEFRYSLHNRARRTVADTVSDGTPQAFHEKAVDYWRSWIDPRDPDSHIEGASSYQMARNQDGVDWLRAARNLIYHLHRLDDPALARLTFAAIYFELFYWWGMYLRYEVIEEFVRDWGAKSRGPQDPVNTEWFDAVRAFHNGYLPGHDTVYKEGDPDWCPGVPDYERKDYKWPRVEAALETILRVSGLSVPPGQLTQHDQWHTRALIDIFLADSLRFRPPAEARRLASRVDGYHREARELLQRCNDYDEANGRQPACEWNLPWIDVQEADEALRRSESATDTAAQDGQRLIAADKAASAVRGGLAGGDAGQPNRDPDDYELLATACMILGDVAAAREGIRPAAMWYADAAVLARAWLYRPRADDFTRMFSGHVSEHVRRALETAEREAAASGRPELATAAILTVLRKGCACQWGAGPALKSVDPDLLTDSIQFMTYVMGPPLPAGRHDNAVDPIPPELARAADEVIQEIWDAAGQVSAEDAASPVA